MSVDWKLKLIALLHDPPDKVLALEGHQRRAFQRMEQLIGNSDFQALFETSGLNLTRRQFEDTPEGKLVKKADQVGTAMDRVAFADKVKLSTEKFLDSPCVRHPLAGRQQQLSKLHQSDRNRVVTALDDVVSEAITATTTFQQRFLWLWRKFPDALTRHNIQNGLGTDWQLIPSDTRIIDHTLWDHLSVTAALAAALPQPALLICSVGPVQDFIRTARRTQDLWMGSYILSYLAWRGIKVVAEEFGPDTVLYPSLRGQPLVDLWLTTDHCLAVQPTSDDLTRATLPNKFVALLPAAKAREIADCVTAEVRGAWEQLADEVASWLKAKAGITTDAVWQEMFDSHKQQMPEVYWSIHRWPDTSSFEQSKDEADAALEEVRRLLHPSLDWEFGRIYNVFCANAPKMVNIGTVYSCLHGLAQRGFEARKGLRDFVTTEERGEKCTLCGIRAALHNSGQSARDHWTDVANQVRQKPGEFVTIKPSGRERLCGVCMVKRLVQRGFFEGELGLLGGFPSTSSVAAASFKEKVIEKLADARLQDALQNHINTLQKVGQQGFHRFSKDTGERLLPRLTTLRNSLPANLHDLATKVLCYDGDAFYDETFTVERLKDDYGLTPTQAEADAAQHTLHSLLMVCRELGIYQPAKYFAVLMLDGDEMGKWLSGDKSPLFAQALHPAVVEDLRTNHPDWNAVLDTKRVLSPALHAAISSTLANFALYLVPLVVEQRYCGRVVYAGGDDVLALLPVDQALDAARELRVLFSGEATIDDNLNVRPCLRDATLNGFLTLNGSPLMTMGPNATASVGISMAHHLSPLEAALAAARHAEKSAKDRYGRNALCVHFLKRSGEELRVGAQWFYGHTPNNTCDTLGLLVEIQKRFSDARISMKFAHAVFDEARTLAAVPAACEAEMHRLLKRQHGKALNTQQGEQQADELAPLLGQLARSLSVHRSDTDAVSDQPQEGMVELAKWLLLLRFLAQGGGND